jgi:hypothetical protein
MLCKYYVAKSSEEQMKKIENKKNYDERKREKKERVKNEKEIK